MFSLLSLERRLYLHFYIFRVVFMCRGYHLYGTPCRVITSKQSAFVNMLFIFLIYYRQTRIVTTTNLANNFFLLDADLPINFCYWMQIWPTICCCWSILRCYCVFWLQQIHFVGKFVLIVPSQLNRSNGKRKGATFFCKPKRKQIASMWASYNKQIS